MENKGEIFHEGIIKSIEEEKIVVAIISQSACASCHANGVCSASDLKEKDIEITIWEGVFSQGEKIAIIANESQGFRALFFAYILPLILLLSSLVILTNIQVSEGLAALISLCLLIPYYLGLYFFRDKLKETLNFTIRKLS
jgi:sigma-E factor negative regulatory protein RseC